MGVVKKLSMLPLIFCLTGCVGIGVNSGKDVDAKDIVAKRAQSRWDALMNGDIATAYEYLSPGTRNLMSLEKYKAKIRTGWWKKASVDSVACVQDRCDVSIVLIYSYRDLDSIESRQSEIWLHEDKKWWYVPKK